MHVTSPTTGTNVHAAHAVNDFRSLDNNGVLIFAYARHIHFSASQSSTHPHWHYKCNNTEGEGWMDDMQAEEPTAANNNQPKWQSRSKMRSKRNGDNEWGWRVLQSIFSPSRFACTPLFDERHPVWWWGVHYVTVPRIYIYITYHMAFWHTLSLSLSYSRRILHIVTAPHLADVYTSILNGQTVYSVVFVFRIFFVVVFSGCTQLPRMLWHCRWWPVFLHVIWSFACIFNFALVCEAARNDVWRVLGVWGW